jgi:acyl dehydratase
MAPRIINGTAGLKELVGQHLGYSDWMEITQERVDQFAEATGDFQWIHVDVERAKKESPFGGPIAHGYLTLSLGPVLMPQVVVTTGFSMGVNYGANKLRFPSPVPVGAKVRLGVTLLAVEDIPGGSQQTYSFSFECDGAEKPSCVAEVIFRSYE